MDDADFSAVSADDLRVVLDRLTRVWPSAAVQRAWLLGTNAFLSDRRPVDVLRDDGPEVVMAAIDAEEAGTFA